MTMEVALYAFAIIGVVTVLVATAVCVAVCLNS